MKRFVLVLFIVLAGCSPCSVRPMDLGYPTDRLNDLLDIVDAGITVSDRPYLGVWTGCSEWVRGEFRAGWPTAAGWMLGLAGGSIGVFPFDHDVAKGCPIGDPDYGRGLFGPKDCTARAFSCIKHVNVLFLGVALNVNWAEIPDFLVGWLGIDLRHDDGVYRYGSRADPAHAATGE